MNVGVSVKRSAVILAAPMALGLVLSAATPAVADTPGCVSSREWYAVNYGDSKERVERVFDTRGYYWGGSYPKLRKRYDPCGTTYTELVIKYRWKNGAYRLVDGYRF